MRVHTGPRRLLITITAALALAAGACATPDSGDPTGQLAGEGIAATGDVETTPTPGEGPGPDGQSPTQAPPSDDPSSGQPQASNTQPSTGQTGTPCLLYTSPSPRDISGSRMPSSA